MERNKRQDWTDVLRDRLQDAQLPLEDAWGASAAVSGRAPRVWWPWAVAGAAAALAAVLLMRPQPKPDPTRLVQADTLVTPTPDSLTLPSFAVLTGQSPIPDAGQTESLSSFAEAKSRDRGGRLMPTSLHSTPLTAQTSQRLPQDSTDVQETTPDTIPVTPGSTRSLLAENEIPDQVGDDAKQAEDDEILRQTQDDIKRDDGMGVWDEGTEPRRMQRNRAGRVALRVQAGFAGTSLSNGIGSLNTMKASTIPGQWIPASAPSEKFGGSIINSSDPYFSNGQGEVQWLYKPATGVMSPATVPVRKAPVFPVSFGVSAALPLSRSWVLTAGLDYMQRDGYRVYDYNPQSLTLHYLGIPVDIHYYFNPESRWRFYLGAGLHAGKCIAATGGEPLKDPILFSGSVMAGTDFRLLPGVRFYLAPAVSGFFNRSAYINTWDEKAYFQLRAGLSFDLK